MAPSPSSSIPLPQSCSLLQASKQSRSSQSMSPSPSLSMPSSQSSGASRGSMQRPEAHWDAPLQRSPPASSPTGPMQRVATSEAVVSAGSGTSPQSQPGSQEASVVQGIPWQVPTVSQTSS